VLRGVFVLNRLLCTTPGAPHANAETTVAEREVGDVRTNREAYEDLTMQGTCSGCHSLINPLGYPFENYDTMGRYITEDHGKPIDASGRYTNLNFANAVHMSGQFAANEEVQACIVSQWLEYAYAGGDTAAHECMVEDIRDTWAAGGFVMRDLMLAIVTHPEFARSHTNPN